MPLHKRGEGYPANIRGHFGGLPRYGPAVGDEDGYFGERVAAAYDDSSADMFEPGVLDPVVDVLAGLAARGRALPRPGRPQQIYIEY